MLLETAASWDSACLVAKSSWGSVGVDWLAPYLDLWPAVIQMRGQGFWSGTVLSRQARLGSGALLGDTLPPALDASGGVDYLDSCIIDFYTERMAFYQGVLTSRWNYYGPYVCIPSRVTIIDSDGAGPHTRVYAVRHAWAPVVVPYLHQVTSASFSRGCGACRAYLVHGSPQVRWLDTRVPPWSR
jgi:hypothetical protein